MELAARYCTGCAKSRQRIEINGAWVCVDCDGGWEMPAVQRRLNP